MTGIDTNVLFYAIDNSDQQKHQTALQLVSTLFQQPSDYKVSVQALAELNYAVSRKQAKASALAEALSNAVMNLPELLTNYTAKELRLALGEKKLFDALIAYTYAASGCDTVLTENLKDMPKLMNVKFIDEFALPVKSP